MWASFAEAVLRFLSVLLPSLVSYQAGKNAVMDDEKDEALHDVELSNKADAEIISIHGNDDLHKRMRDRFSKK